MTEQRSAVGTPLEAAEVRTTYTLNGQVETLTDAEDNRTTFVHDGHGRLRQTRFPVPAQGANQSSTTDYEELSYDPARNVTAQRNRAGETTSFAYDPLMRLSRVDGSGAQAGFRFTRDGEHLVAMHGPGGNEQRLVMGPGTDELVAWFVPVRWFAHTDERGSVIALTDDAGSLVRINRYDEYGRPGVNNLGWLQYTGQMWIAEAGRRRRPSSSRPMSRASR